MDNVTKNFDNLLQLLQPDCDLDYLENGDDAEDLFREAITLEAPENPDLFQCGSYKPSDTTKCLYRLLWLCEPPNVAFNDMYKKRLFSFYSTDKRFAVTVELFKFELGLYFYAPRATIDTSGMSPFTAGDPDADNGQVLTDEVGKQFFEAVKLAVEHEWCVYGGNDFVVQFNWEYVISLYRNE